MTARLAILTAAIALAVSGCAETPERPAVAPMAPCATEDSAGPCYWDASTRGNGKGKSFVRDESGHVTFVTEVPQ